MPEGFITLGSQASSMWTKTWWETPSVRHVMCVIKPQQTGTALAEDEDLLTRALCHVLIDTLPDRAFREYVPAVLRAFEEYYPTDVLYLGAPEIGEVHASPGAAKLLKRLSGVHVDRAKEYLDLHDDD